MRQVARNLTDSMDGILSGKQHVLIDRYTKFSTSFRQILQKSGAAPLQMPPRIPNLNAYVERFMKSLKSETLVRRIFFGERSLRGAVADYLEHYHADRNHQGLNNGLIELGADVGSESGQIECRERFGGMLKYYQCKAA